MRTLLIALTGLVLLLCGSIAYMGGYWENLPVLDRISGPQRFKQFVVAPIPYEITALRGGYSGFPQGIVVTRFDVAKGYAPDSIGPWLKLTNLHEIVQNTDAPYPDYIRNAIGLQGNGADAEGLQVAVYARKSKSGQGRGVILIHRGTGKGVLYIP